MQVVLQTPSFLIFLNKQITPITIILQRCLSLLHANITNFLSNHVKSTEIVWLSYCIEKLGIIAEGKTTLMVVGSFVCLYYWLIRSAKYFKHSHP